MCPNLTELRIVAMSMFGRFGIDGIKHRAIAWSIFRRKPGLDRGWTPVRRRKCDPDRSVDEKNPPIGGSAEVTCSS